MSILRTSEARGDAKIPKIKRVGTMCTSAPRRPGSATLNQFVSLPNEQRQGRDMNCINKWMGKQSKAKAEAGLVAI